MFMLGALNRFNRDRTLAEKVFRERFKKEKLNDYKSLEELIKTNAEFASRGEARRNLDAVRQKGPDLTTQAAQDLKDAEMRYKQVVIAKAKKMKNGIGREDLSIKWPTEKKKVTYIRKDLINSRQFKDTAILDKLIKNFK